MRKLTLQQPSSLLPLVLWYVMVPGRPAERRRGFQLGTDSPEDVATASSVGDGGGGAGTLRGDVDDAAPLLLATAAFNP